MSQGEEGVLRPKEKAPFITFVLGEFFYSAVFNNVLDLFRVSCGTFDNMTTGTKLILDVLVLGTFLVFKNKIK